MKKIAFILLIAIASLFCNAQIGVKTYQGDIDFKDVFEIKGLLYFKADTSLITGRVIKYNKKKVAKKYVFVSQGKPDDLGWVYYKDKVEIPQESGLGALLSVPVRMLGNNVDFSNDDYNDYNSLNRTESYLSYQKEYTSKAYHDMLERYDIYTQINASKDSMNGPFEIYSKAGQIRMKGTYKNDKLDGEWVEYDENGQVISKGTWKDDEWIEYDENGQVIRKGSWKAGEWIEYDENGQVIKKGIKNY